MHQFDPLDTTGPLTIEGDIIAVRLREGGVPSNHVIDPTKDLDIDVEWQVDGTLANLWLSALSGQGSQWRVSCYVESQGAGDEKRLGERNVPVGALGALPYTRSTTIHVPAPVPLDEHTGAISGVYKLVVAVFLNNNSATTPGPYDMVGFAEGPMFQVENPA